MAKETKSNQYTVQEIFNYIYDHATRTIDATGGALAAVWNTTSNFLSVSLSTAIVSTIDSIAAKLSTDAIMNGNTELTPKFAKIVASSSGATEVVAAVTSKKIRVLAYTLQCNAAVNAKFQSHVTPTDKTGLLYNGTNTGASPAFCPVGHFETVAGEALDINLSGAVAVGGHLTYVEV